MFFAVKKEKIDTIISFSLNNRNFSTLSLFFTIIATMIGGTGFVKKLNQFYIDGWIYLLPTLGIVIQMLIFCLFVIPKAHKVFGFSTVSSFMNHYYGKKMRLITGISSSIGVSGFIASQCVIMGVATHILYPNIPECWVNFIVITLMAFYCYNGGIKHVVFTDVLQSMCFIATFGVLLWYLWPSKDQIIMVSRNYDTSKYHFFTAFNNISSAEVYSMLLMFSYFAIPIFSSTQFQRIAMSRDKKQLLTAWWNSTFIMFFATIIPCVISYFLFIREPNLPPDSVLETLITIIDIPGLKALCIIGILAMGMSTADSHINAAAANLANDIYKPDTMSSLKKVKFAQFLVIIVCLFSYLLIHIESNLLQLVLLSNSFYMPIITIPLFAAILGYKLTQRCVLLCTTITFIVTLILQILKYSKMIDIDPIMPCFILNFILLILSHYTIEKWELFKRFGIKSQL